MKKPRKKAPGASVHTRASASARRSSRGPAEAPASPAPNDEGLTIVGIGASAGGLEAFTTVLRSLPSDSMLAIVFVQHLAPQHESALVSLLSGQSALPVIQVDEGMRVEGNRVYVIPPNKQMVITGGDLHISPRPGDRSQYNPIDTFFTSLAQTAGRRAIGVILSGTASDGAVGIREIKAAGGVTVVQTPESAKYDGMPRAAIATGMIDLVLPPAEIGPKLAQLSRPFEPIVDVAPGLALADEEQLHELFDLLRPASGIDFRHYKLPTIRRRLSRRMSFHRLTEFSDYLRMLRADDADMRDL